MASRRFLARQSINVLKKLDPRRGDLTDVRSHSLTVPPYQDRIKHLDSVCIAWAKVSKVLAK